MPNSEKIELEFRADMANLKRDLAEGQRITLQYTKELQQAMAQVSAAQNKAYKKQRKEMKLLRKELTSTSKAQRTYYSTMNKQTGRTSELLRSIRYSIMDIGVTAAAYFGVQAVRGAMAMADSFRLVNSRVKLTIREGENLIETQNKLFKLANDSRIAYGGTADTYARLARNTKQLNFEQKDLLIVTEAISKSLTISGATTMSAHGALVQFGQGLAAGALRGQEFNSVAEQTPRLAQAIADGMGVGIGQLRKLANAGKLDAERLFESIKSQIGVIRTEFAGMEITIGQGYKIFSNYLGKYISDLDDATGFTAALTDSMKEWGRSLGEGDITSSTMFQFAGLMEHTWKRTKFIFSFFKFGLMALTDGLAASVVLFGGYWKAFEIDVEIFVTSIKLWAADLILSLDKLKLKIAKKMGWSNMAKEAQIAMNANQDIVNSFKTRSSQLAIIERGQDKLNQKALANVKGNFSERNEERWKDVLDNATAANYTLEQTLDINAKEYEAMKEKRADFKAAGKIKLQSIFDEKKYWKDLKASIALGMKEIKTLTVASEGALPGFDNQEEAVKLFEKTAKDIEKVMKVDPIKGKSMMISYMEAVKAAYSRGWKEIASSEEASAALAKDWQKVISKNNEALIDSMENLVTSTNDWEDGLVGVAKVLADVSKSFSALRADEFKEAKAMADLDARYANIKTEHWEDEAKANELGKQYIKEKDAIESQAMMNQINGYGAVAGAMSQMFEQGSRESEALIMIQKALSIVTGITAIANAMANGDGYTAIARGLAVAATLRSFGWSGSGSGSSMPNSDVSSATSYAELNKAASSGQNFTFDEFKEGLASASEMLIKFGNVGSALSGTVDSLVSQWQNELDNAADKREDIVKYEVGGADALDYMQDSFEDYWKSFFSFDIFHSAPSRTDIENKIKAEMEKEAVAFEEVALAYWEDLMVTLEDNISDYIDYAEMSTYRLYTITSNLNEEEALLAKARMEEIALLVKQGAAIEDFADELKNTEDANGVLQEGLIATIAAYDDNIGAIEEYNERLKESAENVKEWATRNETLKETAQRLSDEVGFNLATSMVDLETTASMLTIGVNGLTSAELEALQANDAYLRSILSTRDALMKELTLLKATDEMDRLALERGYELAEMQDEINKFLQIQIYLEEDRQRAAEEAHQLKIELAQDYIDSLNDQKTALTAYLSEVNKSISTLEAAAKSLRGIIDHLRESTIGPEYTLAQFRASMDATKLLSGAEDYEAFAASLQDTIQYASILDDIEAFGGIERDMLFAQSVAANQFAALEVTALTEIDYLKQIADNTTGLIASLDSQITIATTSLEYLTNQLSAQYAANNLMISSNYFLKEIDTNGDGVMDTRVVTDTSGAIYASEQIKAAALGTTASVNNLTSDAYLSGIRSYTHFTAIYTATISNYIKYIHGVQHKILDNLQAQNSYWSQAGIANIPAYMSGGFTSDGPASKEVGVVHAGEWVAPAWMVDMFPELFRLLESKRLGKAATTDSSRYEALNTLADIPGENLRMGKVNLGANEATTEQNGLLKNIVTNQNKQLTLATKRNDKLEAIRQNTAEKDKLVS